MFGSEMETFKYVNELNDSMKQIENNIRSQNVEYTDQGL